MAYKHLQESGLIVTARTAGAYVERIKALRDVSEHTAKAYASDLKDFRIFLTARELCPRQEATILAYAHYLARERAAAPRTLRRRMACLRGFYKDLVRSGAIDRSPFADLEMQLPRTRSLPRALSRAETELLADFAWRTCSEDRPLSAKAPAAAILLLISVGLRVGELVSLRPADYERDSGGLHVRGKGRRERRVFVVDDRLKRIIEGLSRRPGAESLFAPDGNDWSTQAVRRTLRDAAAAAGLARRVTPHMLRHTCATLLLEDGVDIRYLQRLLGHENISTTAIYAHVGDKGLKAALESAGLLSALNREAGFTA